MAKQLGEIVVDHRASPGLPEDIARAAGYDPRLCREGKLYEAATLACCECRCVVVKNPFRTRERHSCSCGNYICDICAFKLSMPDAIHKPLNRYYDDHMKQLRYQELVGEGSPPCLLLP